MEGELDCILVSAPNSAGERMLGLLKGKGIPHAALAGNAAERSRLVRLGVPYIVSVNTADVSSWNVPEIGIGKVLLFENSTNLCCRYIQICRSWTSKPICVITQKNRPRLIYKGLGADYVIYTHSGDVSFLI